VDKKIYNQGVEDVMKKNNRKNIEYILLGALLAAAVYLIWKNSHPSSAGLIGATGDSGKDALISAGGKRYLNKETREIEWNNDGLPVKITITRDAVRT
jgi:hypothetical protein